MEQAKELNKWEGPYRRSYFEFQTEGEQTTSAWKGHETNFSSICLLLICSAENDLNFITCFTFVIEELKCLHI